jgi:two-component system cell cycle sensor histidine kinase/response regulator CckA
MTRDKTHKDENLNVLALEDSARDFEFIKEQLIDAGYTLTIERVETEDAFAASLRDKAWDLILADFKLPGFDAFGALRIRNEICPDRPFICVSGSIGEETAIELLKSGAVDYVLKDRPERLPSAVGRALEETREKKIRQQNDEALKEAYRQVKASQSATLSILEDLKAEVHTRQAKEAELQRVTMAVEQAGEMVMITDPDGTIQYVNPAFTDVSGYSREEAVGQNPRLLKSGQQDRAFYQELWGTMTDGRTWKGRMVNKRKDGTLYTEGATISPVKDGSGRIINFVAVKRDVTEREQIEAEKETLQAQFMQAQKMESVGRLAGGVAHDFNNMLGVILGYTELAMNKLGSSNPAYADLEEVLKAARRSADIIRQLLAFARKQIVEPVVLDLNDTVERMLKMLRRLIGEDIKLAWLPGAEVWPVKIDPSQIDQILANLCVNARDAIAGVGGITIETAKVTLDEAYCAEHPGFVPGPFVEITLSDDGCGMDPQTLAHLFEPFFTTKEVGKGTGLGLATVYGILKQNGGFINVYSEPGRGTTFEIYLPRHAGEQDQAVEGGEKTAPPPAEGETLLLVEDETAILNLVTMILEKQGYKVLSAGTPGEALRLGEAHTGGIDLLVTDVIMPEMNGRGLAERLQVLYPNLKVLFMSGYTANAIVHHGVLGQGVHFVQKPFSTRDLAVKVREALGK